MLRLASPHPPLPCLKITLADQTIRPNTSAKTFEIAAQVPIAVSGRRCGLPIEARLIPGSSIAASIGTNVHRGPRRLSETDDGAARSINYTSGFSSSSLFSLV